MIQEKELKHPFFFVILRSQEHQEPNAAAAAAYIYNVASSTMSHGFESSTNTSESDGITQVNHFLSLLLL